MRAMSVCVQYQFVQFVLGSYIDFFSRDDVKRELVHRIEMLNSTESKGNISVDKGQICYFLQNPKIRRTSPLTLFQPGGVDSAPPPLANFF